MRSTWLTSSMGMWKLCCQAGLVVLDRLRVSTSLILATSASSLGLLRAVLLFYAILSHKAAFLSWVCARRRSW